MKKQLIHRTTKPHKRSRLARAIIKTMRKHKWTLADTSAVTGVSGAHLSRILKNGVSVGVSTLAKISKGIKVPAGKLL